jgi:hypothetical protein
MAADGVVIERPNRRKASSRAPDVREPRAPATG